MTMVEKKRVGNFVVHVVIGWALCGAVVGIGRNLMSMQTTLIVHAIAAPLIFVVISLSYFKRFGPTSPLVTAFLFTASIIVLDICIVALLVEKSFEMFTSILGTWLPFALIFLATYVTGNLVGKPRDDQ